MNPQKQSILFVVFAFAVGLAVLIVIAVRNQAPGTWATFWPDLIIGLIGAGAIAALIAWVQYQSDVRRARADQITRAYENLLDVLTPLKHIDFGHYVDSPQLGMVATRMINLVELVDDKEPDFPRWFEAERQLMLSKALAASELITPTMDYAQRSEAAEPFYQWGTEFTSRVRWWRSGRMTTAQMVDTANTVETALRKAGRWAIEMPWRHAPESEA
jgi:hypothetical protein